jgi:hypothetical protein
MSYLYRPTPVFTPPPSIANLSGAVSGGQMNYDPGVNWKGYFDSQRAAQQGSPWLVKSGTMGSFMLSGLGDGTDPTLSDLPLAPVTNDPLLTPISLPDSFFNMSAPIAPAITPYNPGAPPPAIVSSGGSILSPVSPAAPGTSLTSLISSLSSLGTNIAKAATGQPSTGINPAIPPVAPTAPTTQAGLIAQAQSYQAQAAALQTTNPALAAQYIASANNLLAQAGGTGSTFAGWMSAPSSLFPSMSNGGVLAIAAGVVALLAATGGAGYYAGKR